jgi:hypothetical protein
LLNIVSSFGIIQPSQFGDFSISEHKVLQTAPLKLFSSAVKQNIEENPIAGMSALRLNSKSPSEAATDWASLK